MDNMIDAGDTVWVLLSTILVMLMTPAVGFFYGGMVRQKNVLAMMGQSIIILSLISLQWVLIGYSISFGKDHFSLIGSLDWLGFNGVGLSPNADYAPSVPHVAFAMFQCMFAVVTPALIIGAFADRVKFLTFILFTLLWSTLVYDPVAHWVWGVGGWLRQIGSLDFAGGTVVHISAGASALVAALIIGKRLGFKEEKMPAHNIPFTVLGGALLWFGWFGFNGGSALGDEAMATWAMLTTNTAASTGALAWIFMCQILKAKPSVSGIIIGAVAGLVAITPAAGFVSVPSAILIGLIAGILCYLGIDFLKGKLDIDDSLDVLGCHGIGGIWGAIATGLFAEKAINPAGNNGLFFGNPSLLLIQITAVLATMAYAAILTAGILYLLKFTMGLRVSREDEIKGLDISVHGEEAYFMLPVGEDVNALHVLETVKVGDVMNHKVRCANLEDDLEKLEDLMLEKQHFALPVTDENTKLLGMITVTDIRKIHKSERKHVRARSVYQHKIEVAYPEETLHVLVDRMQSRHISNLPVVDSEDGLKLVGIISKTDIIQAYKNIIVSKS